MIKRKKMKRGKKAQFFIIFSVIIGILILISVSVVNQVKSNESEIDNFKTKCENYRNEIFEISKYAAKNEKNNEFDLIKVFSESFTDYMNKSHNFEMFFLYGNASNSQQLDENILVVSFSHKTMSANSKSLVYGETNSFSGNSVEILSEKIKKTYEFTKNNNFYFFMKGEKKGEVYVCE